MEPKGFWLVNLDDHTVNVSLVLPQNGKFSVLSTGESYSWSESEDNLIVNTDKSLSLAASEINLPEESEPSQAAFILPPYWVGMDGRIVTSKLKLIESICRDLSLKPLGFISNDEAIVEEANLKDGFPASFILLYIGAQNIIVSLVYLGKVKDRKIKNLDNGFSPALLETALTEMDSASALPPQIIVFGWYDDNIINALRNYPWIGRRDIETFLHLPDVKAYNLNEVVNIYAKTIVSQFDGSSAASPSRQEVSAEISPEPEIETEAVATESETEPETETSALPETDKIATVEIQEVDPVDLGFTVPSDDPVTPPLPVINAADIDLNQLTLESPFLEPSPEKNTPPSSFKLPAFTAPTFSLHKISAGPLTLLLPALLPLFLLVIFLFSRADITLYITPYHFSKQVPVTFDSTIANLDVGHNLIPVQKKTFDLTASDSVPTTGKKTIGDKSKGEIVIFNKLDKTQNLPKGTVLIDSTGKKFLLITAVSVAGSTSNLDMGILTFGQTKAMVEAADIGPEYNIAKDQKLAFKDFPDTSLVAKTNQSLAGGTKSEIAAVSDADKTALSQKIQQSLDASITKKIHDELPGMAGMVSGTSQTSKNRVDFSREVGETADTLTASIDATVSVFILPSDLKDQIISSYLKTEANFNDADIKTQDFNLSYKISKLDSDHASGSISIDGDALPKFNLSDLRSRIKGKFRPQAEKIIKNQFSRVYNYKIDTNFKFLSLVNPIPLRPENINFIIKTGSE
ncbi:MAG TPA: hypothetical protein VF828_03870 [Patescibacteria group bacterium]